ncbi:MAG: DUF348 domain-containing protein [Chloroflexi bacterium]|jgi:hypothetical protein|nr:DUF348 domain-containing protein [Chloroflexota bacterium]
MQAYDHLFRAPQPAPRWGAFCLAYALAAALLCGCVRSSAAGAAVHLHIDGTDRAVSTQAPTVRALLDELDVALGALDLVEPPLWTPLVAGSAITVTRQWEESEEQPLFYSAHTVRDEFLEPAASRVITAGVPGVEQLTYRVAWDGPTQLARELTQRQVLRAPVDEWRLVGTLGNVPSVAISGTLAYLANGDAWMMRADSTHKRRLTESGLLDGRVFALAPDGRMLLYSQAEPDEHAVLNTLWSLDLQVLNAHPADTGLRGVLQAAWSPAGDSFVWSSAERTVGAPGWRALNDLQWASWPSLEERPLLPATSALPYAWWGRRWHWAPDGRTLAFSQANALGLLDLNSGELRTLLTVWPAPATGNRVWLPALAWAPDGSGLLATAQRRQDDATHTDVLWVDPLSGSARTLYENVGANATLAWAPQGVLLALLPAARTGELWLAVSSAFEHPESLRLSPECATGAGIVGWSPDGDAVLLLCDGDLYLLAIGNAECVALTASGLVSHAVWRP